MPEFTEHPGHPLDQFQASVFLYRSEIKGSSWIGTNISTLFLSFRVKVPLFLTNAVLLHSPNTPNNQDRGTGG